MRSILPADGPWPLGLTDRMAVIITQHDERGRSPRHGRRPRRRILTSDGRPPGTTSGAKHIGGDPKMKDANGREGLSAGAIAKELEASPGAVKKALTSIGVRDADFVKAGCGYYYADRLPAIKAALR
jgi:hypothetical protein